MRLNIRLAFTRTQPRANPIANTLPEIGLASLPDGLPTLQMQHYIVRKPETLKHYPVEWDADRGRLVSSFII